MRFKIQTHMSERFIFELVKAHRGNGKFDRNFNSINNKAFELLIDIDIQRKLVTLKAERKQFHNYSNMISTTNNKVHRPIAGFTLATLKILHSVKVIHAQHRTNKSL